MKLQGGKVVRNNLTGFRAQNEITVNPEAGAIRFSPRLVDELKLKDKPIAFAFPEEGDSDNNVYMFVDLENLCGDTRQKFIGAQNAFNSRVNSEDINRFFVNEENKDKFKLTVETEAKRFEQFGDIDFWALTLKENKIEEQKTEEYDDYEEVTSETESESIIY